MNWIEYILAPKVLKTKYDEDLNNLMDEIDQLRIAEQETTAELQVLTIDYNNLLNNYNDAKVLLAVKFVKDHRNDDLLSFKTFLDTIEPTTIKYDFGYGEMPVHKIFERSLVDEKEIREFIKNLKFNGADYKSADDLVYNFTRKISTKYKTSVYYGTDWEVYGKTEFWATAKTTIERIKNKENLLGDCFTGDTRIIVKNKLNNKIESKTFNELRTTFKRYDALSYNTATGNSEFKPITAFIPKGIKEVVKAKFRNGGAVKVTDNHRFLVSGSLNKNINKYNYTWTELKDIDLNNSHRRQCLAVNKITDYNGNIISDELCNVIGSYVADGNSKRNNKGGVGAVVIAGDDEKRQEKLRKAIIKLGMGCDQTERKVHAYTKVSSIDEYNRLFYEMGEKGTFKKFPNIVMSADNESVKKILKYYGDRDGTKKGGKVVTYSTVSDKLAEQLKLLLTRIGVHYSHIVQDYQYDDANRQPIHRIYCKSNPVERLPNTIHNALQSIEYYGEEEVFDITVADNHNFVLSDTRVIAHNCDDMMVLRHSCLYYLLKDFFPESVWRLRGFIVDLWTGGGHAMLAWVKEGVNDFVPIETTFYDTKQATMWNNDYVIGNQMLYQIRYSFDHEHEYKK